MKKLSPRLHSLFAMVDKSYDEIWDLCCDHGYLGMALMEDDACDTLHFVDRVPTIIEDLSNTLETIPLLTKTKATFNAMDAKVVELNQGKKNLVIIAGLGGKATIEMICTVVSKNGKTDFLIQPKHHLFEVRTGLIDLGYRIKSEELVTENGRFYENLLVGVEGSELTEGGSSMWNSNIEFHNFYLTKLIAHYQKSGDHKALECYQRLHSTLFGQLK